MLMVDEMKKKTPNGALIKQKMDLTFALRRNEVVKDKPAITQICQHWPALFTEHQVCLEFSRVVGKSLRQEFYEALDQWSPTLLLEIDRPADCSSNPASAHLSVIITQT